MRYTATLPLYHTFESIDSEKGIIKGVSLASEGEAKGHGVMLDSKFIRQVVAGGKENPQGLKARFGHPNMCSDALGTYLGRFKNFRRNGEQALADLYLDESSKETPNGNLYDYVLSMAASNPDMFGASVVFKPSDNETKTTKDENGEKIDTDFARIDTLLATDLVDSPASGENLFSTDDLASQVTLFLDSKPEIFEALSKDEGILNEFLNKYKAYKQKQEEMSETTEEVTTETVEASKLGEQFKSLKDAIVGLTEKFSSKPEEVKILDDEDVATKLAAFETSIKEATDRKDEVDSLTSKVTDLEAKLAAASAGETVLATTEEPNIEGTEKTDPNSVWVDAFATGSWRK